MQDQPFNDPSWIDSTGHDDSNNRCANHRICLQQCGTFHCECEYCESCDDRKPIYSGNPYDLAERRCRHPSAHSVTGDNVGTREGVAADPMSLTEYQPVDTKYLVIKREDIKDLGPDYKRLIETFALTDAVVLRLRDAFAGAALSMYASAMGITISTLRSSGLELAAKRLEVIQNYMYDRAMEADALVWEQKHLPD